MTFVEDRLELGDGAVLARMTRGDLGQPMLAFDGGEKRALALLAIAYARPVPTRTLDHLRRAAREWAKGDKCLAYIHLAMSGLPRLEAPEESAYRLFLAEGMLQSGVSARNLLRAVGLASEIDLFEKGYNPEELRVPKGSGPESGQWTSGGAVASVISAVSHIITGIETHLRSLEPRPYKVDHLWPKDAVPVRRNDGNVVYDPQPDSHSPSPIKALFAPKRANYYDVYSAGEAIAESSLAEKFRFIWGTLGHGGTYDFQRDSTTMTFMPAYTHASNYSVGVYMAGAGFSEEATLAMSQTFARTMSSNAGAEEQIAWTKRGWEDANAGYWTEWPP